jgi:hypothetical protein
MAIDRQRIKKIAEQFVLCEKARANHEWRLFLDTLLEHKNQFAGTPDFISLLEQIMQAQQKKDYLYLADLLMYELFPLC